jgi:hypothetical protein
MNYTKEEIKTALEVEKVMLEKDTPSELKSVFAAGKIIGFNERPSPDEICQTITDWADIIGLPTGYDHDLDRLHFAIRKLFKK